MLQAAITLLQLPSKATLTALKTAASPNAINALSTAIAQASIQSADQDGEISVDGLTVNIDFNEDRLLTTAGISTAIALGSVYWIGERLKIQYRYSAMITALEQLNDSVKNGQKYRANSLLVKIDKLSNPLIDPETLLPVESSDELKSVYETLFNKPATNGSMFNASAFVSGADDVVKEGSQAATKLFVSQTDEVIEIMIKKAKPLAGKAIGRLVGAALWVDTVWWVSTSALDLGLNYLGIDEENQKIPILSDIPFIGPLFDLSDSVGSSAVDLVIQPLLDGLIGLFSVEDEVAVLVDAMWSIIISAALNPTLTPFIIAILDFYIDDVGIDFDIPATFNIQEFGSVDFEIDLFGFRPEPIDILVVWLYLIVGKMVFKSWLKPAFDLIIRK